MKKHTLLFLVVILFVQLTYAAPFRFLPTSVTQPDGTVLMLYASGDEFYHWVHDENGYTILKGHDGYCYYAYKNQAGELLPTKYKVGEILPSNINLEPWLKISKEAYDSRRDAYEAPIKSRAPISQYAAHQGVLNNIVIFISFEDASVFSKSRTVYDSRFNSTSSSSGSLKDYYAEVSYNNLELNSFFYPKAALNVNDVGYVDFHKKGFYQPYNASNTLGYKTSQESTYREHNLVVNAIESVKSAIEQDFTPEELDTDGDGLVDNVCFVVQGNSDGWSDLLWAHRWSLYTRECYIHGKRVYDYVFQPENQVTINTLCHEMFHALGAPDLYHYNENSTHLDPVGKWDLMNSGWCHMGAYMKWKYANQKWVTEMPLIISSGTYELAPLADQPSCYKVNSNNPNEYYVLEWRNKDGKYEKNIPRSGLLISRINTTVTDGNRNGPPDEVYIYRPAGSLVENGFIERAAYLPTSGPVINDKTFPTPFLSDDTDGGLRISNLIQKDGKMYFDIQITTTGLSDISKQESMRVYVNNNQLYVEGVDEIEEIQLIDMSGRLSKTVINNFVLSLEGIDRGLYLVSVKANGHMYNEKIIVR